MELSREIAQKIVNKMMKTIPYNINIMNKDGVIIGSGEIERIGNVHEGAKKAIDEKSINEVFNEQDGMKQGVNEPIIINDDVIGVIGITGDLEEVRKFSKLVSATAVLLIEQAKADKEIQNREINKQNFYHELCYRKLEYDEIFLKRAKYYGLDLIKKFNVILVEGDIKSKEFIKFCKKQLQYCFLENKRTVFFVRDDEHCRSLLNNLKDIEYITKIGIGGQENIISISLEKAELAMEFGKKIKPTSLIYSYDNLKFFINLIYKDKEYPISLFSNINKYGNNIELIQTLQVYIEKNGDINKVAKTLNIHRNTLNYRLEKIEKLTGKNPKITLELFELLCGLIWRL